MPLRRPLSGLVDGFDPGAAAVQRHRPWTLPGVERDFRLLG
ncbi:hypothetical protein [Streptomyces sp. TP-A0356]|nr:hypothetical protein [Streptomyces sp. TP-A0356]